MKILAYFICIATNSLYSTEDLEHRRNWNIPLPGILIDKEKYPIISI